MEAGSLLLWAVNFLRLQSEIMATFMHRKDEMVRHRVNQQL
jgi:hypothetical protein